MNVQRNDSFYKQIDWCPLPELKAQSYTVINICRVEAEGVEVKTTVEKQEISLINFPIATRNPSSILEGGVMSQVVRP